MYVMVGMGNAANTSDVGMSDALRDVRMSDVGTGGPFPFQASREWFHRFKKQERSPQCAAHR